MNWFGPPLRVTADSPWPWIDHSASGLLQRTRRAFHTRFRFGSALGLTSLVRVSRRLIMKKACGRLRSHTLETHDFRYFSLPSRGAFSPFPRGTIRYRLPASIQAWRVVSPDSVRVSRVPTYLGYFTAYNQFRLRGFHPLCRTFPDPSAIDWSCRRRSPATPVSKPTGLASSAFARHYLRNLC